LLPKGKTKPEKGAGIVFVNHFNLLFNHNLTIKKVHLAYQKMSLAIYYISLALIIVGLLFSRGMLSTGFISFIANWLIEGDFRRKWCL
jgi:hypothetical protein